ncbi:MAG: hypothetical protein V2I26_09440 [Halieaceae bacterium]|jgi:hypothetical protein|nr:hypothetical protein [Halieaceae bacterium]
MQQRALGNTGLMVSEIGFGGWQLGSSAQWGEMCDTDALRLVDAAPNCAASSSFRGARRGGLTPPRTFALIDTIHGCASG